MLYMVIEKYKNKEAVYKRFREKGRMMPEGVSYVNSWVSEDGNTCYQINEAQNEELLYEWSSNVNDNITMNRKWKIKMYKNDH